MQFLSIRCLNCSNVDDLPRMDHDEIPYCSQCASTSNLVPEAPVPKIPENNDIDMDIDLAAMFNRHLNLTYPATPKQSTPKQSTPITPPSSSPVTTNFISQHYHHSSHLISPPSPQSSEPPNPNDFDPVSAQLFNEATSASAAQLAAAEQNRKDREYAEYLMGSDLSSPNSLNELQIAVAHGIISSQEYSNAIDAITHKAQITQAAEKHAQMMQSTKALEENCSAMDMLNAARRKDDPVYRSSEWFNDYYGGVDQEAAMAMDDESPCSITAWESSGGCRLQPFDY